MRNFIKTSSIASESLDENNGMGVLSNGVADNLGVNTPKDVANEY